MAYKPHKCRHCNTTYDTDKKYRCPICGVAEETFKVPDPTTLRNVWAVKIKGGV